MIARILTSLLCIALLAPAALCAGSAGDARQSADEVEALLERVEAVRKKIERLQADVRYNLKAEVLEIDNTFTGSLKFEAPRLLRMELEEVEGDKKRIYIVGRKYAWIYHPQKKLAERYYMGNMGGNGPVELKKAPNPFEYGLTHGIGKLRRSFDMRIAGAEKLNGKDTTILELRPKDQILAEGQKGGVKLMFWIEDKSGLPVRVREFKSQGHKVETYTLSDVKVNPRRPLIRFGDPYEFDPPGDVVVTTFNEPEEKGAGK